MASDDCNVKIMRLAALFPSTGWSATNAMKIRKEHQLVGTAQDQSFKTYRTGIKIITSSLRTKLDRKAFRNLMDKLHPKIMRDTDMAKLGSAGPISVDILVGVTIHILAGGIL